MGRGTVQLLNGLNGSGDLSDPGQYFIEPSPLRGAYRVRCTLSF